jgi:hypothetical protein
VQATLGDEGNPIAQFGFSDGVFQIKNWRDLERGRMARARHACAFVGLVYIERQKDPAAAQSHNIVELVIGGLV